MYVRRLQLKNIRCFESLEITFEQPGSSILIIGDNGDGKSAVLRSLAMGICDQSSAAALFRELPGDYVRHGPNITTGSITVDLSDLEGDSYRIITHIKSMAAFERVEQELYRLHPRKRPVMMKPDKFPWERVFASGYGAGLRTLGAMEYNDYLPVDAVYSLFKYDVHLQNPELAIRRIVDRVRHVEDDKTADLFLKQLLSLLKTLLQLDDAADIRLTHQGIVVTGAWWGNAELHSLGDGHHSTVTWVLDLLSWWFIRAGAKRVARRPAEVRGIVLLDEVEQHLHPRWQRNVMQLLRNSFPKVQFIATTHSPLVASGCKGMIVHRLDRGRQSVVHPFGWLAEDVYEMMGVPTSRAEEFRTEILNRFSELDAKRLTGKASKYELHALNALIEELKRLPGNDPVRLTAELKSIQRRLRNLRGDRNKSG